MTQHQQLLTDLPHLVRALERDLAATTDQATNQALHDEWHRARSVHRTAAPWEQWRDKRHAQIATCWVLGCVFLRYFEDNALTARLLAGAGREGSDTDRLISAFSTVTDTVPWPRLFDPAHNPIFQRRISEDAAGYLLDFWNTRRTDSSLLHSFHSQNLETDFLSDAFQHLSDSLRKSFAMLATPTHVTDLITRLTLTRTIGDLGDNRVRVMDPACGAGNFLLATFDQLFQQFSHDAPSLPRRQRVQQAFTLIHGADVNPVAVAITRFRLLIASVKALGLDSLSELASADVPFKVTTADALLEPTDASELRYRTEDIGRFPGILDPGQYDAVFVNPPYMVAGDAGLVAHYRDIFDTLSGSFPLTVPFIRRAFDLARRGSGDDQGGRVGLFVSNSFTKREFGKKLATEYLAEDVCVTDLIDTSGAYISGHGTPTLILLGCNRSADHDDPVSAVLGKRGEPSVPSSPPEGRVWQSILENVGQPSREDEWTSSVDLPRRRLRDFPWHLSTPAAAALIELLNDQRMALGDRVDRIGYFGRTGSDDIFAAPRGAFIRQGTEPDLIVTVVTGSEVRDWSISDEVGAFYSPILAKQKADLKLYPGHLQRLWPYRSSLGARRSPTAGRTFLTDQARPWYDWYHVFGEGQLNRRLITFAWVATHNHFSLLPTETIPLNSAPVIELPHNADSGAQSALMSVLNSSTACFWMKQVSLAKGLSAPDQVGAYGGAPWATTYQYTANNLRQLPFPDEPPQSRGEVLVALADRLREAEPSTICEEEKIDLGLLDEKRRMHEHIRARMVGLQEELDWDIYRRYGLLNDVNEAELIADPADVPEVRPGERAFEIVLARSGADREWFVRHKSDPITDVPAQWPDAYKRVVEARISAIESHPRTISLIERPEYKRRWWTESWNERETAALRNWLLDRFESRDLWFEPDGRPRTLSIAGLAYLLRDDAEVTMVARRYTGADTDLADVIAGIVMTEHVPYVSKLCFRPSGVLKHRRWEKVWELQRREDATGERLDIDPPPLYQSTDYIKPSYWRNRGKYDVPNERFISYPGVMTPGDSSLLLGWAGFDHTQRTKVLIDLVENATTGDSEHESAAVIPLIAGIAELVPWVQQWHGDDHLLGDAEDIVRALTARYGLSMEELADWRPAPTKRGRPPTRRFSGPADVID